MQIVDNLFIGPKIMSDRVGISPLLVIAGVAIGGTFGGFVGMFIGVPLVAVAKLVFHDNFVAKRLKEKDIDAKIQIARMNKNRYDNKKKANAK